MSRRHRDNYVIIKDRRRDFFPHGGDRRSETHWNDTDNRLNMRRFRVDPLKDGWDPQEDPTVFRGPRKTTPEIPIQKKSSGKHYPEVLWRTRK